MSTKLIPMAHLVEACGTDREKLAGLSLLIAMAAVTLAMTKSSGALEQVLEWRRLVAELEQRLNQH